MARTDAAAAINATIEPAVTYHTDPRGLGLFARLTRAITGPLLGRTGQHVYPSPNDYHGPLISPQRFTGMARLGTARPVNQHSSTLSAEREANPLLDAANTAFLERMQRGRR